MKKILLTTTALTMLAGAAVAEINVTGDGRMGINSTGGVSTVEYRYRVHFNASGETDGGLSFGAKAGLRGPVAGATVVYGASVFMSNGPMTLRVGNTGGAVASTSGIWGGKTVGYTGMDFKGVLVSLAVTAHTSSSTTGNGPNIVAVDFALGSANVSISGGAGLDTEIAANFNAGSATIGIGHDTGATTTGGTTVTVGFDAGSADIHAIYFQDTAGTASWSLGATMGVGAGSITAYVASADGTPNYGIGYGQSLGGGASLGIGMNSIDGTTTVEAGVSFGF
jgi:outer membrane protein OmpU